jgi:hypothetical protein
MRSERLVGSGSSRRRRCATIVATPKVATRIAGARDGSRSTFRNTASVSTSASAASAIPRHRATRGRCADWLRAAHCEGIGAHATSSSRIVKAGRLTRGGVESRFATRCRWRGLVRAAGCRLLPLWMVGIQARWPVTAWQTGWYQSLPLRRRHRLHLLSAQRRPALRFLTVPGRRHLLLRHLVW